MLTDNDLRRAMQAAADMLKSILSEQDAADTTRLQLAQGEAERARDAARTEKAALDRQVAELRATVAQVQGEARAAEDRRDALRLEVDDLEPKVRTLRAHLDEHKQRVAAL